MKLGLFAALAALNSSPCIVSAGTWQPTQPIEIVVPAGEEGGGDQLARFIAALIEKHGWCPQKIVVTNKIEGSGTEAFLYVKSKKGNDHVLLITLSNIFTLPVAMRAQFKWTDFTPLARLALDEFVLWVNADSPYRTLEDYIRAVKVSPGAFKMLGTGAAQEDQIVTSLLEQAAGVRFAYVPSGGGGQVAQELANKRGDSTVNNPSEADRLWRMGKLRPLAVFDAKRIPLTRWKDIPTMKERGFDIQYLMMRGIFGSPGMTNEAKTYYVNLLEKVYASQEFQNYLKENALIGAFLSGPAFTEWAEGRDRQHQKLLGQLGLN